MADSSSPNAPGTPQAKVRRGDIRHAVIVRTAKKIQRKDGSVIKFDDNACALIGKNGEPLGSRIMGLSLARLTRMISCSHLIRGCWCRATGQATFKNTLLSHYPCMINTPPTPFDPDEWTHFCPDSHYKK